MLFRDRLLPLLLLLLSFTCPAFAQKLVVAPSTTLKQQTANNTSASNSFTGQNNGNVGARNISKLPMKSLLYPSASTKVFAHLQLWFGTPEHINVGYNSNDPLQVERQMIDMASRGIDGVLVDWYGRNHTFIDSAATVVLNESAKRNLSFGLVVDGGGLRTCASTPGCNLTQRLIADLQHASSVFYSAAHYIRRDGRPVIYFFGVASYHQIDWSSVRASTPGNPLFVFLASHDQANGFSHAQSDGGFGWLNVSNDPYDLGLPYLDWYYYTATKYPGKLAMGSVFKGFNDSLAPWAPEPARVMEHQCGKTWLAGFNRINQTFSSDLQLGALQLVTWNDYEEGSEIESGIDNCLSLAPRIEKTTTSKKLMWSLSGSESTVSHYTVYISTDGENLMSLGDKPVGTREFDLGTLELDEATYTFFVQAIGKPSIVNTMSAGVSYHTTNNAPLVVLSVNPESGPAPLVVTASTVESTDSDGDIVASRIDFGDGTVATTPEATHTYDANGIYRVTATLTDNTGLSSAQTFNVMVGTTQPPNAVLAVTPTRGAAPLTVSASTAGSSDADGSIVSATVDFGDGAVIQGSASSHLYPNPGTYTVKATVTDNQGASTTATQTVIVSPASGVTITSPTQGQSTTSPVRITASASSDAPITTMHAYVDGQLVYRIYDKKVDVSVAMAKGWRHVVVQAWDGLGKLHRSEAHVNVIDPQGNMLPVADLAVTPETGRAPLLVNASTSKSYDPDGSIHSSTINFGDGTITNGPSASRTYTLPGTYTITATVTDNLGARSTASRTVRVDPAQATGVQITSPAEGATVTSPVRITAGAGSTRPITAMHVYVDHKLAHQTSASTLDVQLPMTAGKRLIVVQAWDSAGTVYKASVSPNVVTSTTNHPPVARLSLTPTSGNAPLTVAASTTASTDADGSIQSSTIDFGNGTVLAGPNASYTYTVPGTYTVRATVNDNSGAGSVATGTVIVATASGGVQILAPAHGASVGSPVRITATASAAKPITTMHVYVDHVRVYQVNAANLDTSLAMALGSRFVVVQAWDNAGTVYKSSVTITVR